MQVLVTSHMKHLASKSIIEQERERKNHEKDYRNHAYRMRTVHQRIGGNAFIQACQTADNQDYCSALRF